MALSVEYMALSMEYSVCVSRRTRLGSQENDLSEHPIDEQVTQITRAPGDHLEAGSLIGDVQLAELCGEGLSSQVYQARNQLAGKRCAVKLLRPELGVGSVKRGRLLHVAQRIDMLGLPDVAATFDGGLTPDGQTTYLIQEWVEGRPLRELLAEHGALSRRAYLPLMRQLCDVLSSVHSAKLAHLALHGGNIMVQPGEGGPRIRLLDFGVHEAHPPANETIPGLSRSPDHAFYLAPELIKGQRGDHRADIYALSALLYEMITGRPPLVGETFEATVEKQLGETPLSPGELANVPQELEMTVLRGLEKDPARRIPSVEALLAALDPLSATTGQHSPLPRTPSALDQRVDHPAGDIVAGGAIAAGGAIGAGGAAGSVGPSTQADDPARAVAVGSANRGFGDATPPAIAPLRPPRRKHRLIVAIAALLILGGGGVAIWQIGSDDGDGLKVRRPRTRRSARRLRPRRRTRRATPREGSPAAKLKAAPRPGSPRAAIKPKPAKPAAGVPLRVQGLRPGIRASAQLNLSRLARAKRVSGYGTITIVTATPQAKIFLDGNYVGTGAKRTLRQIPAGKHRLHIVLDGKRQPSKDIVLKPKGTLDITL